MNVRDALGKPNIDMRSLFKPLDLSAAERLALALERLVPSPESMSDRQRIGGGNVLASFTRDEIEEAWRALAAWRSLDPSGYPKAEGD